MPDSLDGPVLFKRFSQAIHDRRRRKGHGAESSHGGDGVDIPARTLGELIACLETTTGLRLTPAEPPEYFVCRNLGTGDKEWVDIHIFRGEEIICPKQDLDIPLLPGDIAEAGILAC